MIGLLEKIVALAAQFASAMTAFLWAGDRAEAARLRRQMEVRNAIEEAMSMGPRDQSDVARRLRDGSF
ncbi:MAG: hypothetical protein WBG82_09140 [Parvibaculum sp.]|uniref:hypothetical protein n=1 Tax=Parvibaculum sp. TaxID=2024848 RepID=UPI003C771A9F